MTIQKGTLWKRLLATTGQAFRTGALVPVPTGSVVVTEQGIGYQVRVLESLRRKAEARKAQDSATRSGKQSDPFLPPEPDLTVGDVTDTHIAVLNKFNVLEHHLLIVTRHFEDQDMLLTLADFEALLACMQEYPSLGFYNGGREAGASQQHKHLQLVPLPLVREGGGIPVDPLIARAPAGQSPCRIPGFPFLHSFVRFERPGNTREAANRIHHLYAALLQAAGITPPDPSRPTRHSRPYCLLVTDQWMLLVPRSREFFEDISLNSLAFAGSFFVWDEGQLERLKTYGMMNALRAVSFEAGSGRDVSGE